MDGSVCVCIAVFLCLFVGCRPIPDLLRVADTIQVSHRGAESSLA